MSENGCHNRVLMVRIVSVYRPVREGCCCTALNVGPLGVTHDSSGARLRRRRELVGLHTVRPGRLPASRAVGHRQLLAVGEYVAVHRGVHARTRGGRAARAGGGRPPGGGAAGAARRQAAAEARARDEADAETRAEARRRSAASSDDSSTRANRSSGSSASGGAPSGYNGPWRSSSSRKFVVTQAADRSTSSSRTLLPPDDLARGCTRNASETEASPGPVIASG